MYIYDFNFGVNILIYLLHWLAYSTFFHVNTKGRKWHFGQNLTYNDFKTTRKNIPFMT